MTFERSKHRNVKERKLTESEYRKLHGICTSPSDPAAFGSVKNLVKASGLPRSKVLAYLQSSSTYTKFRATKRKFARLPVVSLGINHIWSLDVAYMEKLANFNNGNKYLLLAVDTLSRKIWVQPMLNKTAAAAKAAFEKMLNFETMQFPIKLWVDQGKEFRGEFLKFCNDNDIEVYSTFSETKSCMAERYIWTLKTILYKFFEEHRTFKYVHLLPKFASLVNRRYNRAIGMPAANVTAKDVPKLIALQFEKSKTRPQKPQFEVGDRVRIALKNMPFRKGYKQQYTNEVFKVHQVCKPKKTGLATTYRLEDIKGEPILGRFYTAELTHFNYLQNRSRPRHQRILN